MIAGASNMGVLMQGANFGKGVMDAGPRDRSPMDLLLHHRDRLSEMNAHAKKHGEFGFTQRFDRDGDPSFLSPQAHTRWRWSEQTRRHPRG
jgi:hypothetical protein